MHREFRYHLVCVCTTHCTGGDAHSVREDSLCMLIPFRRMIWLTPGAEVERELG